MAGTSHTPVLMQRLQKATRERAALAAAAKQLSQRLGAAEARLKNLCYGGPAVIPPTNPSASASSAASAGLTASPPLRSASSSAMPPHKNSVHVADVRQSEGDTNKTTKSSSKKTKEEAVNENENENVNVAKGTKDLPDLSAEVSGHERHRYTQTQIYAHLHTHTHTHTHSLTLTHSHTHTYSDAREHYGQWY